MSKAEFYEANLAELMAMKKEFKHLLEQSKKMSADLGDNPTREQMAVFMKLVLNMDKVGNDLIIFATEIGAEGETLQ